MKLVIEIPKEFEKDFNEDRFEDCLERIASDIEAFGFRLAGRHEKETVTMLRKAFKNSTPLPKGHGDLITKEQAIDLVEFYQLNPQHFDFVNLIDEIKDEKPIIEADKESEE